MLLQHTILLPSHLQAKRTPSGERFWTSKPGFGQVPRYLGRNKAVVQAEKEQLQEYMRQHEQVRRSSTKGSYWAGHAWCGRVRAPEPEHAVTKAKTWQMQ